MSWGKILTSREEGWKLGYRLRPYLGNAPEDELQDRLGDILKNVLTLTPSGKIGFSRHDHGRDYWLQKTVEVNQELWRRCRPPIHPHSIPGLMPFGRDAAELAQRNLRFARYIGLAPVFGRYGEFVHMQQLQKSGRLMMSPASTYKDVRLGAARQDDELMLETVTAPCDYDLGLIDDSIKKLYPARQWLRYRFSKPSDFYLYCMTTSFDFRYFIDFATTGVKIPTCLLITAQDEFIDRLVNAARAKLPGWTITFSAVNYVEPYSLGHRLSWVRDELFFFKHHRYMYQREHRLVCVPPTPTFSGLKPIFLNLGSLGHMTELVTLDP